MLTYKSKKILLPVYFSVIVLSGINVFAGGVKVYNELIPNFKFTESQVSIREVPSPTLASLDYTAYNNSPLRYKSADPEFTKPAENVKIDALTFEGRLGSIQEKISRTPLKKTELKYPMAWGALKNRIYDAVKHESLANILDFVESYKWNDKSVFQSYQEVTDVYLHQGKRGPEFWICLELAPWADFLPGKDDDKNGIREVYAKVVGISENEAKEIADWIKDTYTSKLLDYEGILEWSQILTSYWYPTLNTDLSPVNAGESWPKDEKATSTTVEEEILIQTKSVTVNDPQVVIRGNPLGKVIYQVITVPSVKRPVDKDGSNSSGNLAKNKQADRRLPQNYVSNMDKIGAELEAHGGSWDAWQKQVDAFHNSQSKFLGSLPKEQMGFIGQEDWLYFRKSMEYILAGDLSKQAPEYNSVEHLIPFKTWLEENEINMVFVPIPSKAEIYPEYLPGVKTKDIPVDGIINPWGRKFIMDLQEEALEVIDLLPALLEAKKSDSNFTEKLYQKDDTHWTHRGMMVAANAIAKRIEEYSWINEVKPNKNAYSKVDTTFERLGDIVERLPVDKQSQFKPATLEGQMVLLNGEKRKSSADAPIILTGDSFTGVFELIDCKNAGVGSQISRITGVETDIITSWGGGPNVRQRVYKARSNNLGPKRLVIYLMTARDLYNYSQTWESLSYE